MNRDGRVDAWLPILCFATAVAVVLQMMFAADPHFAERALSGSWDRTAYFVIFGALAFVLWLVTGDRWPIWAWLAVTIIAANDIAQPVELPDSLGQRNESLSDGFDAAASSASKPIFLLPASSSNPGG